MHVICFIGPIVAILLSSPTALYTGGGSSTSPEQKVSVSDVICGSAEVSPPPLWETEEENMPDCSKENIKRFLKPSSWAQPGPAPRFQPSRRRTLVDWAPFQTLSLVSTNESLQPIPSLSYFHSAWINNSNVNLRMFRTIVSNQSVIPFFEGDFFFVFLQK